MQARCKCLTVNQRLDWFDSSVRSKEVLWCVHIMVIISDCLSEDGSSILPRIAKFIRGYDSGSRRGLEPCSASSILASLTKSFRFNSAKQNFFTFMAVKSKTEPVVFAPMVEW